MTNDTIDILQIKIEKAKRQLSDDTQNAIATVPWQATILKMRETKGYSFEQLGDLETETELLLCGLLNSEDYPKELENRMKISKAQANELVNYMNQEVFSKIKEELVKIIERKKIFTDVNQESKSDSAPEIKKEQKNNTLSIKTTPAHNTYSTAVTDRGKIDLTIPELPEGDKTKVNPILAQKLSATVQTPSVKTDHSLPNLISSPTQNKTVPENKMDPYRELPE